MLVLRIRGFLILPGAPHAYVAMASAQKQSANVDLFDAYFRRADLDRDGRISGRKSSLSSRAPVSPNRSLRRPEADWFPWSGRVYTTVSEEKQQAHKQTPKVPELEKHRVNQPSADEVNSLNSKFKEATEADKKVLELQ